MSTGTPPNYNPNTPTRTTTTTPQTILGYVIPLATLIGLFVLIAIGKLSADVGVPLIAAIVGVHGGAAITNNNTTI